jgi:electron transfer flavoprotein alpha subunit
MSILIFSENKESALQLLGKGKALAEELSLSLEAVEIFGQNGLESYAETVYRVSSDDFSDFNSKFYANVLFEVTKHSDPNFILIGATKRGKEFAPRVAAMLGVGCMTECTSLEVKDNNIVIERLTYGGSTIAREKCNSKPTVITVPPRSFEVPKPSFIGSLVDIKIKDFESRVKILEKRQKTIGDADLENASVIVAAGRGFKAKNDLALLEELAKVLGAKIGCSRPISADLGWMDDWVGISGKKVKPMLYLACGVSGTIQHAAGIRDSQFIVSINNDESAGIHNMSDYSIIGDLYEIVPALTKALKEKS